MLCCRIFIRWSEKLLPGKKQEKIKLINFYFNFFTLSFFFCKNVFSVFKNCYFIVSLNWFGWVFFSLTFYEWISLLSVDFLGALQNLGLQFQFEAKLSIKISKLAYFLLRICIVVVESGSNLVLVLAILIFLSFTQGPLIIIF